MVEHTMKQIINLCPILRNLSIFGYRSYCHISNLCHKRHQTLADQDSYPARQRKTKHQDIAITTWQEHFQNILDKGSEQVSNEENGKSETNSPNNPDLETSETHIPQS